MTDNFFIFSSSNASYNVIWNNWSYRFSDFTSLFSIQWKSQTAWLSDWKYWRLLNEVRTYSFISEYQIDHNKHKTSHVWEVRVLIECDNFQIFTNTTVHIELITIYCMRDHYEKIRSCVRSGRLRKWISTHAKHEIIWRNVNVNFKPGGIWAVSHWHFLVSSFLKWQTFSWSVVGQLQVLILQSHTNPDGQFLMKHLPTAPLHWIYCEQISLEKYIKFLSIVFLRARIVGPVIVAETVRSRGRGAHRSACYSSRCVSTWNNKLNDETETNWLKLFASWLMS